MNDCWPKRELGLLRRVWLIWIIIIICQKINGQNSMDQPLVVPCFSCCNKNPTRTYKNKSFQHTKSEVSKNTISISLTGCKSLWIFRNSTYTPHWFGDSPMCQFVPQGSWQRWLAKITARANSMGWRSICVMIFSFKSHGRTSAAT